MEIFSVVHVGATFFINQIKKTSITTSATLVDRPMTQNNPPGETLEAWIDENDFSIAGTCDFLDISQKEYFSFVHGNKSIDGDFAAKLEDLTGIRKQVWLKLEERFRTT